LAMSRAIGRKVLGMTLADELINIVNGAAEDALRLAGHAVLEEAKRNVPVGDPDLDPDAHVTLRESGHVEIVHNPFGDLARVTFDAPYAAKQEFDLHLKHPRGGGAHYLQRALTTLVPEFQRIVASRVDAETRTGRVSDPRRSHRRR